MQQTETTEKKSSLLKNYSRYDVEFDKGFGSFLYDMNGKKYLDFLSGIAVTGFGHNNAEIMCTVQKHIFKVWHTSNLFSISILDKVADKLAERAGLDYVFFCNSGTEANEAAIKFARKWGKGKFEIIAANGGFHGRTMGSLSATGQSKLWDGFLPLTPGFKFVDFNSIEQIENAVNDNTCAIMLEPIQGENGIIVPDDGYLKKVRELCSSKNILLIMDEVQSGMGRTGRFFAYQWEEIKPDIVTTAKGIANGIPLGAVICTEEVAANMGPGSHGSTFGGNPLAVAVANTVINLITDEVLSNNTSNGHAIMDAVRAIGSPEIVSVRGKGLMIGIEFSKSFDAKAFAKELLNDGLVAGTSGANIIRLLPPFIITNEEILRFTEIFSGTLKRFLQNCL